LKEYLRKAWHYIVVPPLVAKAKRMQYEELLKARKSDDDDDDDNEKDQPDDIEEFQIDYKRATVHFFRRLFTEFVGILLLASVSSAGLLEGRLGLISAQSAAFSSGITKLFLVYTLGGISGAHFNPAITLGFTMRRIFPWIWLPFYWLAQFIGAITAALLVRGLFGGQYAALGTNSVDPSHSTVANGFKWEIFLTFCLLFVVLQTATKANIIGSQAAIGVGAVIAATGQIGASKSTSSLNPFRTLGASIINNSPDDRHSLWIFIVGPLLGTLVAYLVVSLIQGFGRKTTELTAAHGEQLHNEVRTAAKHPHF
jgi:aquaporin Z